MGQDGVNTTCCFVETFRPNGSAFSVQCNTNSGGNFQPEMFCLHQPKKQWVKYITFRRSLEIYRIPLCYANQCLFVQIQKTKIITSNYIHGYWILVAAALLTAHQSYQFISSVTKLSCKLFLTNVYIRVNQRCISAVWLLFLKSILKKDLKITLYIYSFINKLFISFTIPFNLKNFEEIQQNDPKFNV